MRIGLPFKSGLRLANLLTRIRREATCLMQSIGLLWDGLTLGEMSADRAGALSVLRRSRALP